MMNSEYEALIEEHCENCYYNKNGFCNIARADKECVYGNLKHDLQELDLLRKLQKEHAKTKKALEIINEKEVDIFYIKMCFSEFYGFERYNQSQLKEKQLTREEYDLLKEVLL